MSSLEPQRDPDRPWQTILSHTSLGSALLPPERLEQEIRHLNVRRPQREASDLVRTYVDRVICEPNLTVDSLIQYAQVFASAQETFAASLVRSLARSKLTAGDQRAEVPAALSLTELERQGERVACFIKECGETGQFERRLGRLLDPLWLATYDPFVTARYREQAMTIEMGKRNLMPVYFSDQAFFNEGIVPPLQPYNQPYGADRFIVLPDSLRTIWQANKGDGAKYEIHEFTRYRDTYTAKVMRLNFAERGEHFDVDQFFGLNLFGGQISEREFRTSLLANGLMGKIIEGTLNDQTTEAFLVTWEGNKVPGGLKLGGCVIAHTQHNSVHDIFGREVGHYSRLVEFGGDSGKVQAMLVVIDRARIEWGEILQDLVDRELGDFVRTQEIQSMTNSQPEKEFLLKLMIGSVGIQTWNFPNPELRYAFLERLHEKLKPIAEDIRQGSGQVSLGLRHPDFPEMHASIFSYENKPYRGR